MARPAWARTVETVAGGTAPGQQPGAGVEPVGLALDRRTGHLTLVLPVRGGPFALQDADVQHGQLVGWGHVLTQFGRESSPVIRLGWSLWSRPGMASRHLDWLGAQRHLDLQGGVLRTAEPGPAVGAGVGAAVPQRAVSDYWQVLQEQGPGLYQHELRVFVTVEARHRPGRSDRTQIALAAGQALADRCAAAGLVLGPALSPTQLAAAMRAQASPFTTRSNSVLGSDSTGREPTGLLALAPGLSRPGSTRTSLTPRTQPEAGPSSVSRQWDAVQIDGAWHRSFWVAHWPTGVHDPRWLEPLLHNPIGTRAISVLYEPIPPRTSRRRITADAVALDSQLQLRDKHELRIPVHLRAAHDEIDQREAELAAGHTEYAHLTLITVTAATPDDLDQDCQTLLDQAAQCGITELRPLHGRHDTAWACTLPIGRAPDRELMNGAGL